MQSNGSGKRCPQIKVAPKPEPVANHASTWNKNSNRLLGTRTSHHVTTDLQNLSLHTDYEGPEDIILGDGSGLGRMPHLQFLWTTKYLKSIVIYSNYQNSVDEINC